MTQNLFHIHGVMPRCPAKGWHKRQRLPRPFCVRGAGQCGITIQYMPLTRLFNGYGADTQ